jgi:spore maturation protein SpmA
MLNKIWPFFIIISFIFALLTGNINNFNNSIFDSCTQAVDLIIKLFGTMEWIDENCTKIFIN